MPKRHHQDIEANSWHWSQSSMTSDRCNRRHPGASDSNLDYLTREATPTTRRSSSPSSVSAYPSSAASEALFGFEDSAALASAAHRASVPVFEPNTFLNSPWVEATAGSGLQQNGEPGLVECARCHASTMLLWRRDAEGGLLCRNCSRELFPGPQDSSPITPEPDRILGNQMSGFRASSILPIRNVLAADVLQPTTMVKRSTSRATTLSMTMAKRAEACDSCR